LRPADLTDADLDAIAKLLRDTIAADRFPLSLPRQDCRSAAQKAD